MCAYAHARVYSYIWADTGSAEYSKSIKPNTCLHKSKKRNKASFLDPTSLPRRHPVNQPKMLAPSKSSMGLFDIWFQPALTNIKRSKKDGKYGIKKNKKKVEIEKETE